jgi:hypothetical protein
MLWISQFRQNAMKDACGWLWKVMALMVSTRLWLGGMVSKRRDRALIEGLVVLVAAYTSFDPLLFVSDGLTTYIDAARKAFRMRQLGTGGRPRLIIWPDPVIAQVVKQYAGRAVRGHSISWCRGAFRYF